MKKKMSKLFVSVLLVSSFVLTPVSSYALTTDLLYEKKDTQTITSGVQYEKSTRLYKGGWFDLHVLTVDVQNPNVGIEVIESISEYGLKKSVQNLAKENDVVAAVNGDFFSSGNPRSSMGQVVENGATKSLQNYYNGSENKYAGVFIDKYNVPFVDYLKTNIGFYNNSPDASIELFAKNKVGSYSKPVYFDTKAFKTTADIDKRTPSLYKIVVENGVIAHISYEGQTVTIPDNGYIIVMNKETATQKLPYYSVGQAVSFAETDSFVFRPSKEISEVTFGISGGGEILRAGSVVSQGLIIGEKSRNPRTCIGVNQDKSKLIIMAVDGRGASIGPTHGELGYLLLEYGAYDAIHLDGGGSTTVALREEGKDSISVVNTPSEGSQRLVANAVGVKSLSPQGAISTLGLSITNHDDTPLLNQVGVSIEVIGFDENHNLIPIDSTLVEFENHGMDGTWEGNKFTPNAIDGQKDLTITAKYGEALGSISTKVIEAPSFLNAHALKNALTAGEFTYLTVDLTNKDGFNSEVDFRDIAWTVNDPAVGYVEGGKFTALSDGTAILTASYNGLSSSISVEVGKNVSYVTSFEEPRDLFMMYYPTDKGISGGAGVTGAYKVSGDKSLLLNYNFVGNSTQTQAAYVCFEKQPLPLYGNPTDICMWVRGDKSGNLLKMVIKDNNNKEYVLPIMETMNSDEWQYCTIPLPDGMAYPIRLDKIYVAALETTNPQSGSVFIDDISVLIPKNASTTVTSNYYDHLRADLSMPVTEGQEDITIFGQTANKPNENSQTMLDLVVSKMQTGARAMIFAGATDVPNATGVPTVKWEDKYSTNNTSNFSIVNLATGNGSIRTSNPDQWRWLQGYLRDFSKNNVIICMDKNIWSSQNKLVDSRENELLHTILKDFVLETGKNVMVVSASGSYTDLTVKDGVRYVNLNGLTTSNVENPESYRYLKLRGDSESLTYDIVPLS